MSSTTSETLAFTAGDLVISITGDGDGSGTYTDNQATPITLEEITSTGSVVGEMTLSQETTVNADGVTESAISDEYGSSNDGFLQLSADGQSLVLGGYGVNAATFNAGGASVYGTTALAQSTSLTDSDYTAVSRVIADISADGTVDTSTTLYNIYNDNNIRSVATEDGTSFYVAGQGVSGDTTQGLFYTQDGANTATAISTATDIRDVQILDGELYTSTDSKQGAGGTSNISVYATLPTSATTGTVLPGIDGTLTLTAAQENGINNADVGQTIHLSPEGYFFADATTLYIADSGDPKEGGLGDGGLQKWTFNGTTWQLDYTLSTGLNLVADTNTSGTSGLYELAGTVSGGEVYLYATTETIGDLDQTYVYGIADTLSATTLPADETFTEIMSASADTRIRGISFAPTASTTVTSTTIVSGGATVSETVTSGTTVTVLSGGILSASTIESGGFAVVSAGGSDIGTTIAQGASETVLGAATGDVVEGTQLVSAAGAIVSGETVYNGGAIDLFLKGGVAENITLTNGGILAISGNAVGSNTTILSGGTVTMESPKATLTGALVFSGAGVVEETAAISAGYGISAVISGFGAGDAIDLTTVGSGATMTTSVVSGNTVATVTDGATSQTFTFAGAVSGLNLVADGAGGEEIVLSSTAVSSGGSTAVSSGVTLSGAIVSNGQDLVVAGGGTIVSAQILSGGMADLSGVDSSSTIAAGGTEIVSGITSGDQIYGTQLVSGSNAVVAGSTVFGGGVLDLYLKGSLASATVVASGGQINISGNATAQDVVLNGGAVIETQSPKANITGSLVFSGAATVREFDIISAGHGISATISGWQTGDAIDITAYGSATTMSYAVVSGNTEVTVTDNTVTDGVTSQTFTFVGVEAQSDFVLQADGTGGEELVAPCFATGTHIRTVRGEVAVEDLQVGDQVVTVSGATRPIRWIGHRHVDIRRHAQPESVRPVRVPAHAFGQGLPVRDLILSPDHALFQRDVLVPVKHLVGAGGIEPIGLRAVTYWHVELDAHDVVLAEGLPAESYLDTGDRAAFTNAGGNMMLHPAWGSERVDVSLMMDAVGYAPLQVAGSAIASIRDVLNEAGESGECLQAVAV